jgi:TfoX/Sxy family transcriptional regulator of competence genes
MAYDELLANRIRELFAEERGVSERPMFGGLAFLLYGNMSVAVSSRGGLLVRAGPDAMQAALSRPHADLARMGSRAMKGWVVVEPDGLQTKRQLSTWVAMGVDFARTLPRKG